MRFRFGESCSKGGERRGCEVRLTLARVDKELAQNDISALLAKGDWYFYFWSGEAADCLDRAVPVERINDLSLEEWAARFHELRRKDQPIFVADKPAWKTGRWPWREG